MKNLIVRAESIQDITAIHQLIAVAFQSDPYSNNQEQFIVDKMRLDQELSISLVATINNKVIGHIAFSKVLINSQTSHLYGLAPVAVLPEYQGKGVGKSLIKAGIAEIKSLGCHGCVVLGEPDYYNRFGFKESEQLTLEGVPPEYFMVNIFADDSPRGQVTYCQAFSEFS